MEEEFGELTTFVNDRDDLEFISNFTKVRSLITNHEMPLKLDIVRHHVESPAYKRKQGASDHDFSVYEPYIVQHKDDECKLYSHLTQHTLNRDIKEVANEMNGKRYKRMLKEHLEEVEATRVAEEKIQLKKELRRKRRREALEEAGADGATAKTSAPPKSKELFPAGKEPNTQKETVNPTKKKKLLNNSAKKGPQETPKTQEFKKPSKTQKLTKPGKASGKLADSHTDTSKLGESAHKKGVKNGAKKK